MKNFQKKRKRSLKKYIKKVVKASEKERVDKFLEELSKY